MDAALVADLADWSLAQGTDGFLGSFEPLLKTLGVEHMPAVTVQLAYLVFHPVLL